MIDLLDDERPELQNNWQLMSFNYQKIVIGYGDALPSAVGGSAQFSSICVVTWSYTDGAQLKFGEVKGQSAANPHSISLSQFQNELNNSKSLSNVLVQIIRSFQLCRALGRLPIHCSGLWFLFFDSLLCFIFRKFSLIHQDRFLLKLIFS